jgi:RNA-directed DNA polymerase
MTRVVAAKSFDVSKREVWQAYKHVKAKRGAAGVDGVTIKEFDQGLSQNLYRIWNRLASGSYFPPPVKRVEIPKADGKVRALGIPTVADRIAQTVVQRRLEPLLEPVFHANSYGYRPGRSAHDALRAARTQCWRHDWVLDLDIKGFFDNIDWGLMMKALRKHADCAWVVLYVERWLRADMIMPHGKVQTRDKGTPQGGVISPLLANLFLHYAFDEWMDRQHPGVVFERYADDIICHCDSQAQAQALRAQLEQRLGECGLQLHPEKTRVVYCADANRRQQHDSQRFDFLGYTFKPRKASNARGQVFASFSPAVSDKAAKAMRQEIREWQLGQWTKSDLGALVAKLKSKVQGWVQYYGLFRPSTLYRALQSLDDHLVLWARRKYRRFRQHAHRAWDWLRGVNARTPTLLPHSWASIMKTQR